MKDGWWPGLHSMATTTCAMTRVLCIVCELQIHPEPSLLCLLQSQKGWLEAGVYVCAQRSVGHKWSLTTLISHHVTAVQGHDLVMLCAEKDTASGTLRC